jgi:aspartyl/glutamyl-tRNA(Asn/Gln) amidotransferase C subunit
MTKISKEEILKLSAMSNIEIMSDEIEPLARQLEDVLTYALRVQDIAADVQEPLMKNSNIFREDVVMETDARLVLSQAPVQEQDFFVVPVVLENEK